MSDLPAPAVQFTPSRALAFDVEPGTGPRAVLMIQNISEYQVGFKVRKTNCGAVESANILLRATVTTQVRVTNPKHYLVKPAQGVVGAGAAVKVTFVLQQLACDDVCAQLAAGKVSKEAKPDKVLIESISLTGEQVKDITEKEGKVGW
jgi:hypothetical protein